ncbi:MAG: beta-galactosidase [Tannerella sp.]|jgi:hypothetical protein|nr:beta-galactosidase [Tannerella sp.]
MKQFLLTILAVTLFLSCRQTNDTIDLSGEWAFALDPNDEGVYGEWFKKALPDKIKLPGSLQEQGYGEDISVFTDWTGEIVDRSWYMAPEYEPYRRPGNVKVPFWLNPVKYYKGTAWYQHEIMIPEEWKGKYVELELERTHWQTTLYVDSNKVNTRSSLSTPHRYELKDITPGKHLLTIITDNRVIVPVGVNSHSISDHTQSNWNGIIGKIKLTAKPYINIESVGIYPDIHNKTVKADVRFSKRIWDEKDVTLTLQVETSDGKPVGQPETVKVKEAKSSEVVLKVGDDIKLWSEHQPALYKLKATVNYNGEKDVKYTQFGFREFKKEGTRFYINGKPTFLRGTLECCIFPLTGYPATDKSYWTKMFDKAQSYGLNHIRFHSWCPPEAAFDVADSLGIYLHVECASWANSGASIGSGTRLDGWLFNESKYILEEYGNHPSFCILLYGNEPAGNNQVDYLTNLIEYWKAEDGRRAYSSGAGWPYIPVADFFSSPTPRIQAWGGGLKSVINAEPPRTDYDWRDKIREDMPTVSHEIGQWCVYPNLEEIKKYTGVLKAKNFEIFRETLEKAHLSDLSDEFLYASGKLQTLCYKADIEAALRTPGFGGFQLLDLHDFPGQGTALVGVLDPFWDDKGYVTGEEYGHFCNQTVPLIRFQKLVWTNDETLKASIEIAHFGEEPLKDAKIALTITDKEGKNYFSTTFDKATIPLDNCTEIGDLEYNLTDIAQAKQLIVSAKVEGTKYENSWNIWIFPAKKPEIKVDALIATKWSNQVAEALNRGETVLLATPKGSVLPEKGGDIAVGFSSIFWNTAWTRGQAPHTLGIYCKPDHPALAGFPTECYSDYQWWDIVSQCDAIDMTAFPADYRPIVHLIDDWFKNRKLGILLEAKVGKGKLLLCSADISNNLAQRPAANQFRQSILEYISSDKFNPTKEIDIEVIKGIYTK